MRLEVEGMQITVNRSEAVAALVTALTEAGCAAVPAGANRIDLIVPWVIDARDAEQARMELVFFLRAWAAAQQPAVEAVLEGS